MEESPIVLYKKVEAGEESWKIYMEHGQIKEYNIGTSVIG